MILGAPYFSYNNKEALKEDEKNNKLSCKINPKTSNISNKDIKSMFHIYYSGEILKGFEFENELVLYDVISKYGPSLCIAKYRDYPDNKDESPLFKAIEHLNNFYVEEMTKKFPEEKNIFEPVHYKYCEKSEKSGQDYPCPFVSIKVIPDLLNLEKDGQSWLIKMSNKMLPQIIPKNEKISGIIGIKGITEHIHGISLGLLLEKLVVKYFPI